MTSPTKAEIAALAGSLSEAQRFALCDMSAHEHLIAIQTLPAAALVGKGLAEGRVNSPKYCSSSFRLTPLGLQVAAHLKETRDVR